jgi:L-ribulose-5-phosphate 3-epimerase
MQIRSHDLAVCSWSLPCVGMRELVEAARELGLSHVQLAPGPLIFLDAKRKESELSLLHNSGLNITGAMIDFPGEDYSTIPRIRATGGFLPDETWPARRDLTLRAVKLAAELRLKILTTHIGFIPPSSHPDYGKLIDRIGELAGPMADAGITLAMETGQETAAVLLQFLNDLPARNVGVNFDPANMILYGSGDPIEAVRTLGRHIRHVHLKDATTSKNPGVDWGIPAALGTGEVDFGLFLEMLAEVGYTGPLAIEQESSRRRVEDVRASIAFLKSLPA